MTKKTFYSLKFQCAICVQILKCLIFTLWSVCLLSLDKESYREYRIPHWYSLQVKQDQFEYEI